jgi:sulfonate transport system ATP-binding protein
VSGEVWKIAEIRLKQLEKSFEVSKNRYSVLRQFSTELDTEKITVILGRSGCGKTTLLRILAGLEGLDRGEILFEKQEKLGVVFQEPRLMPWLTLEQNILFGADKKKYSKNQLKERAEGLLKLTGLEKFGNAYPDQLSGGMMQRAALGRALACDVSYLLMDEPFAALDHFTRQTMQKEFLRICAEERMGALFVTHSVDEALLLGDEILIMENGKVGRWFDIGKCHIPETCYRKK